ncbi:MAG: 2-oxoacid:acceptor oxidoreductase family protein [Candidatus Diapherotrites archaeon]|nr:2-oxoacid:acceptor oxidoreductase family protein [Candidatus Micrarchaeota archaeon]MBU1939177.1 2-oxoacid:acceptor oxidoreductase family protein [Candidatus Micrarchaeota archaeon]
MYRIRLHGRGGQGVKKASNILARAAYLAGFHTQDFAIYGAERQGAPLTSFVRMDKKPIQITGYMPEPDAVIVLDTTIGAKEWNSGISKETIVLLNSYRAKTCKVTCGKCCAVDATNVAMDIIGRGIANVAMLGAFIKLFEPIKWGDFEKAVKIELGNKFPREVVAKNLKAAKKCYELV